MRIHMLSQWYPPEPDFKVHLLAKHLAERGNSVTSITGFPNYPGGHVYPGYCQRIWQREELDGLRVLIEFSIINVRLQIAKSSVKSGVFAHLARTLLIESSVGCRCIQTIVNRNFGDH